MTSTSETGLVWISGATSGIGEALAETVPWADTRVVSLSRRPHPRLDTVPLELGDPSTWRSVGEHFAAALADFAGERAIFVHNAYSHVPPGFVGETGVEDRTAELIDNLGAALTLGDLFLAAAAPAVERGVDVGLVMVSSASARIPYAGMAVYGAVKAGLEQWVRSVRLEREDRGCGPWVVAVRPGFVDTPSTRAAVDHPARDYPTAPEVAAALDSGQALLAADAAVDIWAALPPAEDDWLLLFGQAVRIDPT